MRRGQRQTLLQTTMSGTRKSRPATGGDNRGKSNSRLSYGLQTTRTSKLRPASGISLTLNINNITRTNIAPHLKHSYHPTLKPLTQYMQLISRISLSLSLSIADTYHLTQCHSHSPQSTFIIQSSRPLTPCLAHLLTHSLTHNLVKLHLWGYPVP